MRFSVVIPLFNKREYVSRAVESVLGQSQVAEELIVVDDGSTDGSGEIVEAYGDMVTLIRQANAGEAAARNSGIRAAKGTHIAFLDADDCWKSEFLAIVRQLVERHPDAAIYGTGIEAIEVDRTRSLPEDDWRFIDGSGRLDYPAALARWVFPLSASSVCVPAARFREIGLFDERLKLATDIDMWVRLCLSGPAFLDRRIGATYHKDALDRSTTVQPEFWDKRLFFVDVLEERLRAPGIVSPDRRNLKRFLAQVTYEALVAKADSNPGFDLAGAMQDRKQSLTGIHFLRAGARNLRQVARRLITGVG